MEASTTRQITRRALLRLAFASPAVVGLHALPMVNTAAQPRPVRPRVDRLRLDRQRLRQAAPGEHAAATGQRHPRHAYASEQIETEPFSVTGITWDGAPSDAILLIRTRDRGHGTWSEWSELHDDGHGPDLGRDEGKYARRGTDPVIAGESDAIEVRIESQDGNIPNDMYVELIDPGESPADATAGADPAGAANASVAEPTIRSRADWGADESLREPGDPDYGSIRGMFVHHTAGSNSYSQSDVPAIIRGIYAYHVTGRGWRDIGYNFLIDKWGRIWEGRWGGTAEPVVGAHTGGYNAYAFGASVLGTYTTKTPEANVIDAYAQLIAWKFSLHSLSATGRVAYPGQKTLPKISGHRDTKATECPGSALYTKLDNIRTDAANQMPSAFWPDLPDTFYAGIDAALMRLSDNKIFFFSGSRYVRYTRVANGVDPGYPKPIAGNWGRLPVAFSEGIDAALWQNSTRKIYFFKDSQYVRYTPGSGVDPGYPKPIAGNWGRLPSDFTESIDAAFWRNTNKIYFFKDSQYVRYTPGSGVDPGYPKSIGL